MIKSSTICIGEGGQMRTPDLCVWTIILFGHISVTDL